MKKTSVVNKTMPSLVRRYLNCYVKHNGDTGYTSRCNICKAKDMCSELDDIANWILRKGWQFFDCGSGKKCKKCDDRFICLTVREEDGDDDWDEYDTIEHYGNWDDDDEDW